MKKQNALLAYILIGIGIFFLLRQLKIPILTDFYSWQTFLIVIGLALLIHGYSAKHYQNLFSGTIVLGVGIHLHGLAHYSFWIDHWAVYVLIVGIAFIIQYSKTKNGLFPGVLLILLSLLLIFSNRLAINLTWLNDIIHFIERFWPIILIIIGFYLLQKKK
ncbi:hypothetical protein CWR45_01895 [Oceanobacillus chungangensis]|uniref:LiaI-LiaF-like transmembrane region domain-containing protein n=1 Tax=Oceanobacillus chungangensis TaxID=1229152 RepID=A0A3D8Q2G4_9BACI|nr:DUF5668 domain-containing protein [Oceanobacillus chungangensis]RDW21649.1 hypothetical protein CWR45_01895 [Oceanobacillus chungangensis]